MSRRLSRRTEAVITTAFATLVAVVILGPMLAPGFPLRFDLVSVPRPVLGDDALGLGDRLPRAIPLDGVTAVLATLLPDAWLTQLLALLALVLAGTGAARLAGLTLPGRLIAVLAAQWNPFVAEQLAIGHVPHLLAYGAAPWAGWAGWSLTAGASGASGASAGTTATFADHARSRADHGPQFFWAVLVLAVALGSVTPGGGALVALAAVAGLAAGCWSPTVGGSPTVGWSPTVGGSPDAGRRRWLVAGLVPVVLLQLPWLVAAAMAPGFSDSSDGNAGLTAFALRGETGWGRLIDAAGLGGMWNQVALPGSRGTVLAQFSTLLVAGLALGGVPHLRSVLRRRPALRPAVRAAVVVSLICYLIAVLPVLPGGERVLSALVDAVPGAGLIRDGHRWLALPALGFAVLAGHTVTGLGAVLTRWLASRESTPMGSAFAGDGSGGRRAASDDFGRGTLPRLWRGAAAVLTACLLVAALPDLAWGLSGRLRAWHYPAQWASVRNYLDGQPDSARVLVLPWQPFRAFPWSGGGSAVLDPAPRLLPRQTIVSDALPVSGRTLPAEGPGSRAIAADLAGGELTGAELRAVAVGWVLTEKRTPGEVPALPPGWTTVADGPDLRLSRAPGSLPSAPRGTVRLIAVVGSQLLYGGLVLVSAGFLASTAAIWVMRRKR